MAWLIKHHHAALLWDPGLGKTTVFLKAFDMLRRKGGAGAALVVAPLRVCDNVWTHDEGGELHTWKQDFGHLRITLLHGPEKDDRLEDDADLYVINFDGLKWLVESGGLKHLIKQKGVTVLGIDELSKLKKTNTKRFRLLRPWFGRFSRRWGLTGSPAPNGLEDLFGQIYAIDRGAALGQYITHYRHKYFNPSGYGGYKWVVQEGAEKKIYKAIKNVAMSARAEDHLDLPDLVVQNIWVNLPPKVRKWYDELEQDLITLLDGGELITAPSTAVARGRCRQIASGGIYAALDADRGPLKALSIENFRSSGRKTLHLHDEKTDALIELIGELQGSPLLVGYEFQHDLERISKALQKLPCMKKFGKRIPAINGSAKPADVKRAIQAWNRGEVPVLCCHPASAGHGLNLQRSGHHVAWYSLPWDFELYDQFIRRVYRQGNTAERVVVCRIAARKTLDADIISALAGKQRLQDALLDALKMRLRRKGSK